MPSASSFLLEFTNDGTWFFLCCIFWLLSSARDGSPCCYWKPPENPNPFGCTDCGEGPQSLPGFSGPGLERTEFLEAFDLCRSAPNEF